VRLDWGSPPEWHRGNPPDRHRSRRLARSGTAAPPAIWVSAMSAEISSWRCWTSRPRLISGCRSATATRPLVPFVTDVSKATPVVCPKPGAEKRAPWTEVSFVAMPAPASSTTAGLHNVSACVRRASPASRAARAAASSASWPNAARQTSTRSTACARGDITATSASAMRCRVQWRIAARLRSRDCGPRKRSRRATSRRCGGPLPCRRGRAPSSER